MAHIRMQLGELGSALEQVLKLRVPPIGMKLLESRATLDVVPRVRRPGHIHTTDQVVAQAARLGWTVGITADDLVGDQCRAVIGLGGQDAAWYSGKKMAGVWFETVEGAALHQRAMHVVPVGKYEALLVAPAQKWDTFPETLQRPDILLFYATPGAMIYFINGLQWTNYTRFDWSVVGESSCADSWGRALKTGEPSLSIPCFAERRYGGVLDDEMLMAIKIEDIITALNGMTALARNGFRYPFANYGIQQDVRSGMGVSYAKET